MFDWAKARTNHYWNLTEHIKVLFLYKFEEDWSSFYQVLGRNELWLKWMIITVVSEILHTGLGLSYDKPLLEFDRSYWCWYWSLVPVWIWRRFKHFSWTYGPKWYIFGFWSLCRFQEMLLAFYIMDWEKVIINHYWNLKEHTKL